ncbi:preprotein translocase subunit YajC [Gordonia oryzae]|uniref:Preprotein translocase subunit YajC n=1 Tax=Gordonia oryzae TaxID=2487349 RepID=A0A3N4GZ81_9ACTN|nr:preprotein translocase subunit YajC [Gordonia oryzae]RPA66138.1 preprotein translocase subunit YajC [Gordonia oryzae]
MESLFLPLLLVLMVGFMYFSVRKQKKRAAEAQEMQNSVQTGTRIQLSSGLFGTVIDATSSEYVDVEIATGLVTRWNRLAVMRVIPTDEAAATYPGYTLPVDEATDDASEAITPTDVTTDRPNLDKSGGDTSADSDK